MRFSKIESEMDFSFEADRVFDAEVSEPYTTLVKRDGMKVCDFIALKSENIVMLIEAKKTSPNPGNPESKDKVREYGEQIHLKIVHTLLLAIGMALGRFSDIEHSCPEWLKSSPTSATRWIPILVVKDLEKPWIPQISEKLGKVIHGTRLAFRLDDLLIMNEEMAKEKGFIA
jgi:hypothetical protein